MLALAHPGPRGCRTRANDGSTRVYRGWEDAHPWVLVEIREPSLAAPVTAAVVGVVPGAALPALPGGFRDAPEASAGPVGGVPALVILNLPFCLSSDGVTTRAHYITFRKVEKKTRFSEQIFYKKKYTPIISNFCFQFVF